MCSPRTPGVDGRPPLDGPSGGGRWRPGAVAGSNQRSPAASPEPDSTPSTRARADRADTVNTGRYHSAGQGQACRQGEQRSWNVKVAKRIYRYILVMVAVGASDCRLVGRSRLALIALGSGYALATLVEV